MTDPLQRPIAVLVVDDEPAVLRLVRRSLDGTPFEVILTQRADEALDVLRTRPVDILVSDIDMPGMNGLELVRLARRDHPDVVRMLITGNATMELTITAINEGEVLRFFTKPFDIHRFRDAIVSVAGRLERLRRDGRLAAHASRRQLLLEWLDRRFPGLTTVARSPSGEVAVDVDRLLRDALASSPALSALLRDAS